MLEAGGSLGRPQTPELQGIVVIPAGNPEVGTAKGFPLGAGLEEVFSPWCPWYLHEHALLPWARLEGLLCLSGWSSFPLSSWAVQLGGLPADLEAAGDVLGDPC